MTSIEEFLRSEMPSIALMQERAAFKTRRGHILLAALTDSAHEVDNNVATHILERAGGFGEFDELGDTAILILSELLFTDSSKAEEGSAASTFRRWYQYATDGIIYDRYDEPLWTVDAAWPVFICMMRRIACTPDITAACRCIHKELRRMKRHGDDDSNIDVLCRQLLSALADTDVVKRPFIDWDAE
jgi:hypothetical protein